MTTTGGPGHDTEPVVLDHDAALDGDDIVVIPHGPEHPRKHHREIVVGVIVGILAIGAAAIALAARHDTDASKVSTAPVAKTPAGHPTDNVSKRAAEQTTVVSAAATAHRQPRAIVPPPALGEPAVAHPAPAAPSAGAGSSPGQVGSGNTVAPTTPTPTLPPTSPPSALTWSTDPGAVSVKAGGHVFLTVTVTNPTAGSVTLPHPLSCAPGLQTASGAPVGGGVVCEAMAQIMAPHSHVVAHYAIYATDTGDASGAPLPAGQYAVNVEGLHTVKVTVTS